LVVKELEDEHAHIKLEIAVTNTMLAAHDPSLGRKKRLEMEASIQELNRRLHIKADQIYHLYDVLEGQNDHELTQQDVEDLTREIRMEEDLETKGKGKKVTLDVGHDDETGHTVESEMEESSWQGFEHTHTGTLDLLKVRGALPPLGRPSRRTSAY
jgi:hypothetical protein